MWRFMGSQRIRHELVINFHFFTFPHGISKHMETVADFIFLSSKITADSDCSHEIKRHLLLGRKVMTSLNSVVATHSSILAWRIPWTEEPGRLQSMGPQRVGHD